MNLIDTHSHIYSEEFDEDIDEAMQRCKANGISKILLPNVDSSSIERMEKICSRFPGICYPMMGLHPCYVKENYKEELTLVESKLNSGNYIAVGEIGLDFYWDLTFKEQQIEALQFQVELAKKLKLPVAIHCRNSFTEVVQILKSIKDDSLKGVFHCFTGSIEDAQEAIALGFYLGIGGVLTFKNSGLDKTIREVDLKHLILETDSPYLPPVPFRGKRNESSYLKIIAEKLAEVKSLPLEKIAEATSNNAKNLFHKAFV